MHSGRLISVLMVFLLLPLTGGYAQNKRYQYQRDYLSKFDSYTTGDGLSGREVLDIHQDRYGFLWVATRKGLNRFDGYDFQLYTATTSARIRSSITTIKKLPSPIMSILP